jgi:hypothetical protein
MTRLKETGQRADRRKNYGRISKYFGFHIWNIL